MSFNLLISCMYQKDTSIVQRTNVQSDVIIVNQCDKDSIEEFDFINKKGLSCHGKFICTTERGLSKSRNMAIRNSWGDVCLICDDDEYLEDDCEEIIVKAYNETPNADIISFAFDREDKCFSSIPAKHNFRSLLKTSSVEISFRREAILEKRIWFDEKMGSGSGNGAGEENMFLMTCKRKGLRMFYNPREIGRLLSTDSMWFKGYNTTYFENFGWASRRIMGGLTSLAYFAYWIPAHRGLYNQEISSWDATKSYLRGWRSKR